MSTLGGSIRIHENFDDDIPLYEETLLPNNARPWALNPTYVQEETATFKKIAPKKSSVVQEEEPGSRARIPEPSGPYFDEEDPYGKNDDVSPFENDGDFASV